LSTKKGPYLKGGFTVSQDPCCGELEPRFIVHLSLRWGNRVLLKTFQLDNGGNQSPCLLTEPIIMGFVYNLACMLDVEVPFGLTGTPVIKELILTDSNCSEGDPSKDIIAGDIIIAIVPTLK